MILTGFAAAGSWRLGVSFEPAAPTQLSSCLGESWKAVNARKELQIGGNSGVFDQKSVILIFFCENELFSYTDIASFFQINLYQ